MRHRQVLATMLGFWGGMALWRAPEAPAQVPIGVDLMGTVGAIDSARSRFDLWLRDGQVVPVDAGDASIYLNGQRSVFARIGAADRVRVSPDALNETSWLIHARRVRILSHAHSVNYGELRSSPLRADEGPEAFGGPRGWRHGWKRGRGSGSGPPGRWWRGWRRHEGRNVGGGKRGDEGDGDD